MAKKANRGSFVKGDTRAGRRPGALGKKTVEVRELCKRLVEDKEYQRQFKARFLEGDLAPGVEQMVWAYAYGKPKETVELQGDGVGPITGITWVVVKPKADAGSGD